MPTVYGWKSKDPDGYLPTFRWTKVSGPASFNIVDPNAVSTKITGLVKGTYVFRLTVTDNEGASAYDDVSIIMQ